MQLLLALNSLHEADIIVRGKTQRHPLPPPDEHVLSLRPHDATTLTHSDVGPQ